MNKPYEACIDATERDEAWSLSRTPNYARALAVDSIDASAISPEQFQREYVARNRPCVLRGAVTHWPAFERWQHPDYLKSKVDNVMLSARSAPTAEYVGVADQAIRADLEAKDRAIFEHITFHDFIDRATTSAEQLVLHSIPLNGRTGLQALNADVAAFSFVRNLAGSRMYPSIRAFFYRHSYTDWHYHASDEALMTQVVGSKEVLLLAPDQASWDAMWPVLCQTGYGFGVDHQRFPKYAEIRPSRVIVNAGDALFIPTYWWHAVASVDNQFGITVAATFKTPLHINADWRFPGTRRLARKFLPTRVGPIVLGVLLYSAVRRLLTLDFNRTRPRFTSWL